MGFRLLVLLLSAWVFAMSGCGVETVDVYALPPPNIFDITLTPQFEPTGLVVQWRTDQPATSQLDYTLGETTTNTLLDRILKDTHSIRASEINTPATYILDIQSTNERGQTRIVTVILPRESPVFSAMCAGTPRIFPIRARVGTGDPYFNDPGI